MTGGLMEDLAYGGGFVVATVALALTTYGVARAVAAPRLTDESKALADSMVFRVGALHGLILALVFAQELVVYKEIRDSIAEEAAALADIHFDIARYDAELAGPVRAALRDYVAIAVGPEWAALGREDRLTDAGWEAREIVNLAVLDLVPETPREEVLRARMLADLDTISEVRNAREAAALFAISPPFWVAAFAGVVLVVMPYFRFAPTALNLMLLSVFAGYSGLVLSFIYAFADPFGAPGRLEPTALLHLLETSMGYGTGAAR